jgi:MFS family permease
LFKISYNAKLYFIINLIIFIDTLLYGIVVPAVPHYAKVFGVDETGIGMIFFAYSGGLLLTSFPMGVLCDRIGQKQVLLIGAIVMTLSTLSYAASSSLSMLVISRFIQGIGSSATWAAGLALVAGLFPAQVRGQRLSLVLSAASLGTIIGPAAGGFLFANFGYTVPFIFIASISILPLALLIGKQTLQKKVLDIKAETTGQAHLKELLYNPNIFWGAIIVFATSFGFGIVDPILPLDLTKRFKMSGEEIGLLFGLLSLTYTICQPVAGYVSDQIGRKKILIFGLVTTAVTAPFIAIAPTVLAECIAVSLFGIASAIISAPSLPLMAESMDRVPQKSEPIKTNSEDDNTYGTSFGLLNTAYSLGLAVGPIAGGIITKNLSFSATMLLYAGILILVSIGAFKNIYETLAP